MHRRLFLLSLVFILPMLAAVPASAEAAPPGPASRAYPAPQSTAWVSPGPDPEFWLTAADGVRPALQGQSEQFAAVEWAPDGESVAVFRVPNGSETFRLGRWWLVDLEGNARPLDAPPDWLGLAPDPEPVARPESAAEGPLPASPTALTPPATIRVYHSSYNSCRNVPVGTITVLPFEEYVARVLPAEVYASWPAETLKSQAIAIRTYAWYQIRHPQPTYDVTDSTSYQYMCDARYASTDAAVAATAGRYIAYNGQVILAQYSAENSHPTLDGGTPYLKAVIDPVGLGMDRNGHGHGISQWGARRWAGYYGWNAVQIIAHYYTGVEVVDPLGRDPLVAVTSPWPGTWVTGARAYISGHGTGEFVASVTFSAPGFNATDTDGSDGWNAEWAMPGPLPGPFDLTLAGSGRSHSVSLAGADAIPPAAELSYPALSAVPGINVHISATDGGPSGLAQLAVGPDRSIRADGLTRQMGGGSVVADPQAYSGAALVVPAGSTGRWAGTMGTLPLDAVYRAHARVRTSASGGTPARIELYDPGDSTMLGWADLRAGDWPTAGGYYDFPIDFWLSSQASGNVGVRVISYGSAEVAFDRLRIMGNVEPFRADYTWTLGTGPDPQTLVFQVIDGAGNIGHDLVASAIYDPSRPGNWQLVAPTGWVTTTVAPLVTATVVGDASGLNAQSAQAAYSTDGGASWSGWSAADMVTLGGGGGRLEYTWPGGQGDYANLVRFRIAGGSGWLSESPAWPVPVDVDAPELSADAAGAVPNATGWITAPVTLTLVAEDLISGVERIVYHDGEWREYAAPVVLQGEGTRTVEYYAVDAAGLRSATGSMTFPLDTHPPEAYFNMTSVISPGLPLSISWAAVEGNGVSAYDVETSDDGILWTPWQTGVVTTTAGFGVMPEGALYFRVRATDVAGNVGPWKALGVYPARAFMSLPVVLR